MIKRLNLNFKSSLVRCSAGLGLVTVACASAQSPAGQDELQAQAPELEQALAPGMDPQAVASGRDIYVAPDGNDSNAGTRDRPFRTLARGARDVKAGGTVHVAPGTYEGGFRTNASGTAAARIRYVSTKPWGAKIVPPANSKLDAAWYNRGSHVDIDGFEVAGTKHRSGTRWRNGIYTGGSHVRILRNHVYDVARRNACSGAGGSGIVADSYHKGQQTHIIGNIVHDIGPTGCRFVQGIYVSTTGSVKNNQVYRVAEAGIHLWHDARNVIITNNTVVSSNTGIIVGGGDYYHTRGPSDHVLVYSNIVYDNKRGIYEVGDTGRNNKYRNNLVYRNASFNWKLKNGLNHVNTVSSEPYFSGYRKTGTMDLRLTKSSPAIGRGSDQHAESLDFNGRPRNDQTGFDIGAYQH